MMVSVVMVTYKHEKFIKDAILGVIEQICDFDLELIVSDDFSPDETPNIVNQLLATHPMESRVKYTRHSKNKGMLNNFLWALKQCKGKYIALCDGDDYWSDVHKLQKQVDFLEKNSNCVGIFHAADWLNESTGELIKNKYKPEYIKEQYTLEDILSEEGNPIPTCSIVYRNENHKLPDWFYKTPYVDFTLHLMNLKKGNYGFINQSMAVYREHGRGVYSGNDLIRNLRTRIYFYRTVGKELFLSKLPEFKNVLFHEYLKLYKSDKNKNSWTYIKYVFNLVKTASNKHHRSELVQLLFPRIWLLRVKFHRILFPLQ
jgi:glycosyltransferase involved in cell wall biosynthesis